MRIEYADRLKKLPPYTFEEVDKAKQKALEEKRPIIDLGVGDPDQPTPSFIVEKLRQASLDSANHKYALNRGLKILRQKMASWYGGHFGVELDPDTEVLPLLGSKDGISHIPLAFINPGDEALIPDPGYPPYRSGVVFAGGKVHLMPLVKENNFVPDLGKIEKKKAKRCKLMHLNYPNNPTGAVCDLEFYKEVTAFAKKHNIIVCQDAAYIEVSFDGFRVPSFLEAKGARDVGVEFHSFSKSFNMAGWRVGMAFGNKKILDGLGKVKANIDSGIFMAIQLACVEALEHADEVKDKMNKIYAERRNALVNGLNKIGWKIQAPVSTFYIWAPVFGKYNSLSLTKAFLERADIVVTPGTGFGKYGEGYIRMALVVDTPKLEEAVNRIKRAFFN